MKFTRNFCVNFLFSVPSYCTDHQTASARALKSHTGKHTHSKYSRHSLTSSKGFTVMLWSDSCECFSKSTTRSDEGLLYLSDNRDITDSTTLGVSPMTKLKNLKHHLLIINVTIIAIYPKIIDFKIIFNHFNQCFVPLETESRIITFTNGLKNEIIGDWETQNVHNISLSYSQRQFLQWPHSFVSWRRAEEREGTNMTAVPDEVYLHNVCWAMWQVFCGQLLLWPLSSFWNF